MAEAVLVFPNAADIFPRARKIELKLFPDGETYLRIPVKVSGKNVLVAERCWPGQDSALLRVVLGVSQLKAMGARKIRCLIPYLPYARQDKRFLEGEALSAQTVCRLLKFAGCSELVTFDCHFLKREGSFAFAGLRIKNISLAKPLLALLKKKEGVKNPVVISPDVGASYMVEGEKEQQVMRKARGKYEKGKHAYRGIAKLEANFEVRGRDVIVIDDMISTGSTMLRAVDAMKKAGASRVFCLASHGLFLKGSLEALSSLSSGLAVSDSIPCPASLLRVSNALK